MMSQLPDGLAGKHSWFAWHAFGVRNPRIRRDGNSATSHRSSNPPHPATTSSASSTAEARSVFIFQLPPTKGMRPSTGTGYPLRWESWVVASGYTWLHQPQPCPARAQHRAPERRRCPPRGKRRHESSPRRVPASRPDAREPARTRSAQAAQEEYSPWRQAVSIACW